MMIRHEWKVAQLGVGIRTSSRTETHKDTSCAWSIYCKTTFLIRAPMASAPICTSNKVVMHYREMASLVYGNHPLHNDPQLARAKR